MVAVTVFSAPDCGVCSIAKEFLKRNNVDFQERNVREDPKAIDEIVEMTGQRRIPVIVAGDAIMVGFNADQLKRLLGIQLQPIPAPTTTPAAAPQTQAVEQVVIAQAPQVTQ